MQATTFCLKAFIRAMLGIVAAVATTGVRAETPQLIDESRGFYAGAGIGRSDYQDGCTTPGAITTSCDTRDTAKEHIGIRAEWEQFNNVGTNATGGQSDIQMWPIGVNYKF